MTEPCDLSAIEARRLIGAKALSPVELLESCLRRIDSTNATLNAVIAVDGERAMTAAREAEQTVADGRPLGLLHGLPLGVKDLNATRGLRTTFGSLLFRDHVPDQDDDVVAAMRTAGAVILGKTNTPEFGAGANTWNLLFGATGNPFDPDKTCAGSSGGGAVALAAGMMPLANGSDYGGSLRTPAAFCGVSGFRPSPSVIPSPGRPAALLPFSVQGPMGRSLADAYLLLRAQARTDRRDPFTPGPALDLPARLVEADLGATKAAISTDLGCAPVDAEIRAVFEERVGRFFGAFAAAETRDPDLGAVHEAFEVLRGVNFVAAHKDKLARHRDLLGPNVIDNTERGLGYDLADVAWAAAEQGRIYQRFTALFDDVDVLICPAAAVSPFPHSQLYPETVNGETMPTYMRWLALTYALTMALPAVCCLPCGVDRQGLPFGIQVVGPNGSDAKVLRVAAALERVLAADPVTARPQTDLARLAPDPHNRPHDEERP